MKILMVHNFYRSGSPGGEDVVFEQEKRLLESAGHHVIIYIRRNDEMNERNPFDALRTLMSMRRSAKTYREVSALLRAERPDVAHFHNIFPLISASAYEACASERVPVVQTVHNYRMTCSTGIHFRAGAICEACTPGKPWAAVQHACYRDSVLASAAVARSLVHNHRLPADQFVDRFIVLGDFAAERLRNAGVSPDRIVVKSNFVPPRDSNSAVIDVLRRVPKYAFFSGRLSVEKGLRTLLRAWRELPSVPLKIAGEGPLSEELRRQAKVESLNIEFLGMQTRESVVEHAASARLQIVASEWFEAGVPLVCLEAMACGTPIITARVGGLRDLGVGRFFEAGNASDLAQQVRSAWSDDNWLTAAATRGRNFFESRATSAQSLATLEAVYRDLAQSRVAA